MGNVPLTSGGQLPICPAQPGCSALPISLRVKAKSVWKNPCAWLFLACSVSNHMKVSIFYFEKEEKTPNLQVFCVCVLFFFSSTGANGVKNRCCVNLKMRHQGLWLTKSHISVYFMNSQGLYKNFLVCSKNRLCVLLGTSQAWWLPELCVIRKTKSQRVKLSQVTANVWVWQKFMGPSQCTCESSSDPFVPWSSLRKQRPKKRIFLSCKFVKLLSIFQTWKVWGGGRDCCEWKQYLGQPKHLIWLFTAFIKT